MYETLVSQLVQGSLAFDLADETKENLEILRDMSQSQESRADVHAALQDDVKLDSLITNVFNQMEASDTVARIRMAHNPPANRKETKRKHKEDEQCVQNLIACINKFHFYPFDPASPTRCTLQFIKNTPLYASVPLSKRMTFAKAPNKKKPGQDLRARAAEIKRTALKAVIDLVEVSQLVDLSGLLEHRVVEESVALFNSNGTYRKTQKSQLIQKLSLQPVDMQELNIALFDMGMICRTGCDSNVSFYGKGKKSVYNDSSHGAEIALTLIRGW